MKNKKSIPRSVIDPQEAVHEHCLRLRRFLQAEEQEDRQRFKQDFLDRKPEERERSGKALYRLELMESHYNPSGHRLLTFGFGGNRPLPRYSLGPGDVVRLSGLRTPDNEALVGTVYDKDKMTITVAFRSVLPAWMGRERSFQLSQSSSMTTYDRMYQAVRDLEAAKHNTLARLRDISLGLKKVSWKDPITPDKARFFNANLNELQKKAVLKAMQAEDILLVHGPPGTGKTSVLVEIIRHARRNGESILVSAPSNAACDHMVECLVREGEAVTRLGHPARMSETIREHTLAYKLTRHPLAKVMDQNEARLEQLFRQKERRTDRRVMSREDHQAMREEIRALKEDNRNLEAQIFRQVWHESDIVVATHTGCGDAYLKGRNFDWVIVDEATQGVEPATWIPISRAGRVVMAGDHKQLPPTFLSRAKGDSGVVQTLFERFYSFLNPEAVIQLEEQYRMHHKIMDFPSRVFYSGTLKAAEGVREHSLSSIVSGRILSHNLAPFIFMDTAGLGYEEKKEDGGGSRYNEEEARLVIKEIKQLQQCGVLPGHIAVISPYSAQVKLLNQFLQEDIQTGGLEIDSVDAFQGREKEVVIVSLVRSNLTGDIGFLADTRRMNVGMTRAKRKLILIGDSATLSNLTFYRDLIQYAETIDGYRSAWEYELNDDAGSSKKQR